MEQKTRATRQLNRLEPTTAKRNYAHAPEETTAARRRPPLHARHQHRPKHNGYATDPTSAPRAPRTNPPRQGCRRTLDQNKLQLIPPDQTSADNNGAQRKRPYLPTPHHSSSLQIRTTQIDTRLQTKCEENTTPPYIPEKGPTPSSTCTGPSPSALT